MDLKVAYNILNFFINKRQGKWYPPEELDPIADVGQLRYYKNCFIAYGKGQRLNDALAPFKKKVSFTTNSTGLLSVPDDYMDLINIQTDNSLVCPVLNDDELDFRKKSQVIPPSLTRPFAEEIENWDYQLYPQQQQSGILTYFRRPPTPKFAYTVVSGRVIVYDPINSDQLLWGDDEIQSVLISALESIGINMSEADLLQWDQAKNAQNLNIKM